MRPWRNENTQTSMFNQFYYRTNTLYGLTKIDISFIGSYSQILIIMTRLFILLILCEQRK